MIRTIRKEIGITLIALVVTIVILLILAGVTIALLTGDNGIINMAQKAKNETRISGIEEEIQLWNTSREIEDNIDSSNIKTLEAFVLDLQDKGLLTENEKEEILATGKLTIGEEEIIFQKSTYIANKEDLETFRNNVNNGVNYRNERVILENDIDLGGIENDSSTWWTPIGSNKEQIYFEGTFDGQNHTISNLYVEKNDDHEFMALFSSIKHATIQNLIVDGNLSVGPKLNEQNDLAAAGIVGVTYGNSIIKNCINNATVSKASDGRECGGVLGCVEMKSLTILENCVNNGTITGGNASGGLVGTVYGALEIYNSSNNGKIGDTNSKYCGGLVARAGINTISIDINDSYNTGEILSKRYSAGILSLVVNGNITINNCYNEGNIDVTNRSSIGGAAGIIARIQEDCGNVNIINCSNISNIITKKETVMMIVGGILAECQNENTTIVNCYNIGNLEGDYVSGIIGRISEMENKTEVKHANIINSYNVGTITGRVSKAGIIILYIPRATVDIKNVYYLDTCADIGVEGGASNEGTPLSDSYMKSQEFVDDLNNNITSIEIEEKLNSWKYIENTYPKFE